MSQKPYAIVHFDLHERIVQGLWVTLYIIVLISIRRCVRQSHLPDVLEIVSDIVDHLLP